VPETDVPIYKRPIEALEEASEPEPPQIEIPEGLVEYAQAQESHDEHEPESKKPTRKRAKKSSKKAAPARGKVSDELESFRTYRMRGITATVTDAGVGDLSKAKGLTPSEWEAVATLANRVVEMNRLMGLS
jgi:hypothetical protein